MTAADLVIRWSTALAGFDVAAVAAVGCHQHAYDLVLTHGESGRATHTVLCIGGGVVGAVAGRPFQTPHDDHPLGGDTWSRV
jgi:hypothetical protein